MKIGFTGIDQPEGKTKYDDEILRALAAKDKPKKVVQVLSLQMVVCMIMLFGLLVFLR